MRNKNNKRNGKSTRKVGREIGSRLRPHRMTLPNHPTEVNLTPWNSLTVALSGTSLVGSGTTKSLTLAVVFSALRSQIMGLLNPQTFVSIFSTRIKSIRVWGPIPVVPTPLRVTFYDVFENNVAGVAINGVLQRCVNYADGVNRARVGFSYSDVQRNYSFVLSDPDGFALAQVSAGTPTDTNNCVIYVDLLWRASSGTDAVTIDDEMDSDEAPIDLSHEIHGLPQGRMAGDQTPSRAGLIHRYRSVY